MDFFIGVVEDRNDPLKIGRVRVRVIGDHTDDKESIPTSALPWATVSLPTTSPSISGVGHTPFMVEGTWVVGVYMDQYKQEPLIIGTIPGNPSQRRPTTVGFSDPYGKYPKWTDDSDLSYSAREEKFDQHPAYLDKAAQRLTNVQTASPPKVSSVADDRDATYYEDKPWDEPEVSDEHIPEYPYNHVFETESGHMVEFDDTDGQLRYHRYHPAGSFEEIYNDGSRTLKVVGHGVEIVMNGKDVYINGDVNMTVNGNMRHLVYGNYHLEVEKDYTVSVKGSMQTKIDQNCEQEIGMSRSINIGELDNLTVVGDQTINVLTGKVENISQNYSLTVSQNMSTTVFKDKSVFVGEDLAQTNLATLTITSKGNVTLETPSNFNTNVEQNINTHADGDNTVTTGGKIYLN